MPSHHVRSATRYNDAVGTGMTKLAVGDATAAGRLDRPPLHLPVTAEEGVGRVHESATADRLVRVVDDGAAHVFSVRRYRRVDLLASDRHDLAVDAVVSGATVGALAAAAALHRLALNLAVAADVQFLRVRHLAAADRLGRVVRLAAAHRLFAGGRRGWKRRCRDNDLDNLTAAAQKDLATDETRRSLSL